MPVIGLTGNIASGKSFVSSILQALGACIIDADKIARDIIEPGQQAWSDIKKEFGPQILNEDGTINRAELGARVFGVPEKLKVLNHITHPRIIEKISEEIARYREADHTSCPVLVIDAALLIEAGMQQIVETIWTVYIPEEIQLERLMLRDNLSETEARARIASQMPAQEKNQQADRIIDNSGTKAQTAEQVKKLWQLITMSGAEQY